MTNHFRIFQGFAYNFQQEESQANLGKLLAITKSCQEQYKKKFNLAQKVMAGVQERRRKDRLSDNEPIQIQPVTTLEAWVGDTACGMLRTMIESKTTTPYKEHSRE